MIGIRAIAVGSFALLLSSGAATLRAGNDRDLPQQTASWAMYQHSPDRNAVFPDYRIASDWTANVGKVNGGLALVGSTLLMTTFTRRVVALDVQSGRVRWSAPLSNIAMSTPIVAGNTVYVGTGRNGVLRKTLVQRFQFRGKGVWGATNGDEIAAFDLRSGAARWTHATVGEDMPSAVYYRGRVIFANGDWHAYALRADTGQEVWSTDVGGVSTMASAVLANDEAVFGVCTRGLQESYAVALDARSGKMLWRSPYGYCDASPTYANGEVFVSAARRGASELQPITVVAALDAKTGKARWVYREEPGLWSIVGSAEAAVEGSYADGIYYQSAPFTDKMLAFDGATGQIRWKFHTLGPVKMGAVVSGGRIYFGDVAGLLYTLDAHTGKLIELREFKQPFSTTPPIVAGDKLIIANGTAVHAIPLSGRPAIKGVGWSMVADSKP